LKQLSITCLRTYSMLIDFRKVFAQKLLFTAVDCTSACLIELAAHHPTCENAINSLIIIFMQKASLWVLIVDFVCIIDPALRF
jgi:hypothetical protein